eukprot:CAMPEP_0198359986 /NCGR_PEP_ID=MMETSP1450-20131203/136683_1 /TAXON_ID=753684 ORGANISM="Madagascaria erythrocladiodes, Strain CCMP3234" /NCGR_SAMPLE_ID=MMETSP1450 /ASSEMBLY_ACC=CAM_ASM_001115 /LENGTH=45 /DNA_ID= /DNA_START= /DNA_END= /DNA_ORIENTATION=
MTVAVAASDMAISERTAHLALKNDAIGTPATSRCAPVRAGASQVT